MDLRAVGHDHRAVEQPSREACLSLPGLRSPGNDLTSERLDRCKMTFSEAKQEPKAVLAWLLTASMSCGPAGRVR